MELYLVNVDASRRRVETAQLARTLLDQIAADLAATRARRARGEPGGAAGGSRADARRAAPIDQAARAGGRPPWRQRRNGGGRGMRRLRPAQAAAPRAAGHRGPAPVRHGRRRAARQRARPLRHRRADSHRPRRLRQLGTPLARSRTRTKTPPRPTCPCRFATSSSTDESTRHAADCAQQGVGREVRRRPPRGLVSRDDPHRRDRPDDPPLPTAARVAAAAPASSCSPPRSSRSRADLLQRQRAGRRVGPGSSTAACRAASRFALTIAEPTFQPRPSRGRAQRLAEGRYRESELVEYRRFVRLPFVAAVRRAAALLPAPRSKAARSKAARPAGGANPTGRPRRRQPGGGHDASALE